MGGVGLFAAFFAGVASFASPCVLPLVPAYLSIIGGFDVTSAAERRGRVGRLTRDTLLFSAGFAVVFVLLGLSASALGQSVIHHQATLTRVSGVVIVVMALFLWLSTTLPTPGLLREFRSHPVLDRLGPFAAPLAGAAFAFGWTPCVGPILASVLAVSSEQGHVGSGVILLSVYSTGLAVPFLAVAVAFDRFRRPLRWMQRHGRAVTYVSAAVLFVLGFLLILDRMAMVVTWFQEIGHHL